MPRSWINHCCLYHKSDWEKIAYLPPANEVWGKVMFSVCLLTGGGVPVVQNFATRCPTDLGGGSQIFFFRCHLWWGVPKFFFLVSLPVPFPVGGGVSICNTTEVPPRFFWNFFFTKKARGGGGGEAVCLLQSHRRTVLFDYDFDLWHHILTFKARLQYACAFAWRF